MAMPSSTSNKKGQVKVEAIELIVIIIYLSMVELKTLV
jgi:hypothetical protein